MENQEEIEYELAEDRNCVNKVTTHFFMWLVGNKHRVEAQEIRRQYPELNGYTIVKCKKCGKVKASS